jgi:hypothetical protein
MRLVLESFNLADAEKQLCTDALAHAGTIVDAAGLLGITRHALKRRIIKHDIEWPRPKYGPNAVHARGVQATQASPLAPAAPSLRALHDPSSDR